MDWPRRDERTACHDDWIEGFPGMRDEEMRWLEMNSTD